MKATQTMISSMMAGILCVSGAASAFAQNCKDLESNAEWTANISELAETVQSGDLERGKAIGVKLDAICSKSPMYNYLMAMLYRKAGDLPKANYYITNATMFTNDFNVSKEMLERLWYTRYEMEHPEVITVVKTNEEDKAAFEKLMKETVHYKTTLSTEQDSNLKWIENTMWAGVGIGATGVALAIVGGALIAVGKDTAVERSGDKFRPTAGLKAGYAMLGVGIGAAVSGAIVTGFAGYKYVKEKNNAPVDVTVSYNHVGLSFQF